MLISIRFLFGLCTHRVNIQEYNHIWSHISIWNNNKNKVKMFGKKRRPAAGARAAPAVKVCQRVAEGRVWRPSLTLRKHNYRRHQRGDSDDDFSPHLNKNDNNDNNYSNNNRTRNLLIRPTREGGAKDHRPLGFPVEPAGGQETPKRLPPESKDHQPKALSSHSDAVHANTRELQEKGCHTLGVTFTA